MAVLLLEMAYSSKETKNSNPDIIASIKKLIRWLRTMQQNDPVASKAYKVVLGILKSCSPHLQAQVKDILAYDGESATQFGVHQSQPAASEDQNTEPWLQDNFNQTPDITTWSQQPQTVPDPPLDGMTSLDDFGTLFPQDEFLTTMPFSNPFFTSFDESAPVANMQDLWSMPGHSDPYDPDLSDMNIPPDDLDLDTDHRPQN
jgi:hypothetical protein